MTSSGRNRLPTTLRVRWGTSARIGVGVTRIIKIKINANRPRFGTMPTPLTGGSGLSPSADNARHTPGPP